MLTVVFFMLILLALLFALSGLSDAAGHIFSFFSPRRGARRLPRPYFVSARFA